MLKAFFLAGLLLLIPGESALSHETLTETQQRLTDVEAIIVEHNRILFELGQKIEALEPFTDPPFLLVDSGPIDVTEHGQVIENLRIISVGVAGILIRGFDDVVIRNVEIFHSGAHGIRAGGADRLVIENVRIINTGAQEIGPNASANEISIALDGSHDVTITRAQLWRGSAGIYTHRSKNAQLRFIEGHDFRGPSPRGQLVQFNQSPDCLLEDFSVENDIITSHPEDNVSIYKSSNCTIRRGLVDGNNAPSGVGIMFELSDTGFGGLVEDVDAINQGNGNFASVGGQGVIMVSGLAKLGDQGGLHQGYSINKILHFPGRDLPGQLFLPSPRAV